MDDLRARVERLERQVRRQRRLGVAALIGLAALVSMGQAEEEKRYIETDGLFTHYFVLRDFADSERARLSFGPDSSGLSLGYPDGRVYGTLEATSDGVNLRVLDEHKQRLLLGLFDRPSPDGARVGTYGLWLHDRDGQPQAELTAAAGGGAELRLLGPDRRPRVVLSTATDGGQLTLHDGSGAPRIHLGVGNDGPRLTFLNADDEVDMSLHGSGDGPSLRLFDAAGASAVLGVRTAKDPETGERVILPASSLLLAESRESAWEAPPLAP